MKDRSPARKWELYCSQIQIFRSIAIHGSSTLYFIVTVQK
jgi:hypothetical protein